MPKAFIHPFSSTSFFIFSQCLYNLVAPQTANPPKISSLRCEATNPSPVPNAPIILENIPLPFLVTSFVTEPTVPPNKLIIVSNFFNSLASLVALAFEEVVPAVFCCPDSPKSPPIPLSANPPIFPAALNGNEIAFPAICNVSLSTLVINVSKPKAFIMTGLIIPPVAIASPVEVTVLKAAPGVEALSTNEPTACFVLY